MSLSSVKFSFLTPKKSFPLIDAVRSGNVDLVASLLDAGADINATNEDQLAPVQAAMFYKHAPVLKLLVDRGADLSVIKQIDLSWASSGSVAIQLLDSGFPIEKFRPSDLISLVLGSNASVPVLQRLRACGVDLNALHDADNLSLCNHAVAVGRTPRELERLFRTLVDVGGVDLNRCNPCGFAAIHSAAGRRDYTAMRLLVELGADIDHQDRNGRVPGEWCGQDGTAGAFVEFLFALGADIGLITTENLTAPQYAAFLQRGRCLSLEFQAPLSHDEVDAARRRIAKIRLDLVRRRSLEICIGLQALDLNALQLCEILMQSFGALGSLIEFHQWWAIVTKVKHWKKKCDNENL